MLTTVARRTRLSRVFFSSKPPATVAEEEENPLSPVTERRQEMEKSDLFMVYGKTGDLMPPPTLPENPREVALIDEPGSGTMYRLDGEERHVTIRQGSKKPGQSPLKPEYMWGIYFNEDGSKADKWSNSLMGWTSNADVFQSHPPLFFKSSSEAAYFAKKRGWTFIVHHPLTREVRHDDAQYQDNFLPQKIAKKVQAEGKSCDYWHRDSAMTSHYFRPLKYHGDGTVPQYGPNGEAPIEKHVDGIYMRR